MLVMMELMAMQRKPGRVRAEKPVLLLAPQRYGQCGGLSFMGSGHGSVAAEACQAPPSTARGTAAWVGDMYSQPIRRTVRQRAMRCACHDSRFASFPGVSSADVATCCTRATKECFRMPSTATVAVHHPGTMPSGRRYLAERTGAAKIVVRNFSGADLASDRGKGEECSRGYVDSALEDGYNSIKKLKKTGTG